VAAEHTPAGTVVLERRLPALLHKSWASTVGRRPTMNILQTVVLLTTPRSVWMRW
jgi:hypothetical protein